ncbi:MAG: NAD-dependent epimerase/dehydratase family protein [Pirellulaceae bacterium]
MQPTPRESEVVVMHKLLVTGSSGLIGSEVCQHFEQLGWSVHGVDNNARAEFFGAAGDTRWNQARLQRQLKNFRHHEYDIRDREGIGRLIQKIQPDAVVHTASQPSHDLAAKIPYIDFDTNAVGTLNLLEAVRQHAPDAVFVHLSTNKVYGDAPNRIPMTEMHTRWDYAEQEYQDGITEAFPIDQSKHSLFGASKLAADVLVQEYGRYFGLKSCCLRGGCLTGPNHSGVELHGFLSYLIRCNVQQTQYTIYGYQGKQVRDNIHSRDVALFIEAFIDSPRRGEVYNLGGGRQNSGSILEAFQRIEQISGKKMVYRYLDQPREADHICYISNLSKIQQHYPGWKITKSLDDIFQEIHDSWQLRGK